MKYRLLIISLFSFFILSCEKMMLRNDLSDDPLTVFEYLWEDLNNRYSYFEQKNIHWDSLGMVYRKKIHGNLNEYEFFDIMGDMLFELRDGHVNLTSSFNRSRNWDWARNYPVNYNESIVDGTYLGSDYYITGPFLNVVIDSVLFISYRSFGNIISHAHLDQLMLFAENMKGVIIDIRNNGGGSLRNAYLLASCFTEEPVNYARSRIKTGPGRDDFSAWEVLQLSPRSGKRYSGPLIVLTNRRSYSASNQFAQMMKSLPHVILLGDQTGGGGGTPVYGELPNGWIYRFSASQTVTMDGEHIEFGVPVDTIVGTGLIDELNNRDTIIDTALRMLRN